MSSDRDTSLCQECGDEIQIVKTIRHGSFGSVYHVKSEYNGEMVEMAMKQVSTDYSKVLNSCKEAIRTFHENAIDFFFCLWNEHKDKKSGHLLIFMELCMDKTLSDWIAENRTLESRNGDDMKFWIKQILCALDWFHCLGLIHRDLKPANIFFARNSVYGARGTLKVGDFGMIKMREKQENCKPDENGLFPPLEIDNYVESYGTEEYAAPELLKKKLYNYKVDIFSLGIIAAELLFPYKNPADEVGVRKAFREGKVPKLFKNFSKETTEFLSKATKPNYKDRAFAVDLLKHPFLSNVHTLQQEEHMNNKNDICQHLPHILSVAGQPVRVGFAVESFNNLKKDEISGNDKMRITEKVKEMQMILAGSVDEKIDYKDYSIDEVREYLSDLIFYGERVKHRKIVVFGLETDSVDAVKASYTLGHVRLIPSFEVWSKDGCREWMRSMLEKNSDFVVLNGNGKLSWMQRDQELEHLKSAEFKKEDEMQFQDKLISIANSSQPFHDVTRQLLEEIRSKVIPEDRQCLIMRIDTIADFLFGQKIKVSQDYQETKNVEAYLRLLLGTCFLKQDTMDRGMMDVKFGFTNTVDDVASAITENSFSIPTFQLFLTEPVEHWESWSEVVWDMWVQFELACFERKKSQYQIDDEVKRKFFVPKGYRFDGVIVRVGFLEKAIAHLSQSKIPPNCMMKTLQELLTGMSDDLDEELYHYAGVAQYVSELFDYAIRLQSQKVLCFSLEQKSFDKLKDSYKSSHVKLLPSFRIWMTDECREFMNTIFGGTEQLVFPNGDQPLSWVKREENISISAEENSTDIENRLSSVWATIFPEHYGATWSRKSKMLLDAFGDVPTEHAMLVKQIDILSCFLFGQEVELAAYTDDIDTMKAYFRFLLGACKFLTSWGEEDFEIDLSNDINEFSGDYVGNCHFVLPAFEIYRTEPIEHWESWSEIAWAAWWKENSEESENEADDKNNQSTSNSANNADSSEPFTLEEMLAELGCNKVIYVP